MRQFQGEAVLEACLQKNGKDFVHFISDWENKWKRKLLKMKAGEQINGTRTHKSRENPNLATGR